MTAQLAGRTFSAAVAFDAIITGERFFPHIIQPPQLIGQCPGFGLINPHQRRMNDKFIVHSQIHGYVQRFDKDVAAIGITAEIGFSYAGDNMFSAFYFGQYARKSKKQHIAPFYKGVGQLAVFSGFYRDIFSGQRIGR